MSRHWILRISWPGRSLWQNSRYHRARVAKSVAKQREEAWAEALARQVKPVPDAILEFQFHPPAGPGGRPDVQNCPATVKGAIDGIADAMRIDDRKFRRRFPDTLAEPVKVGCVLITVREPEACAPRPTP